MALRFDRLVGASADVKELEYVTALLQTCRAPTRDNATVGSQDLRFLLESRYRVSITRGQAVELVKAFGGPGGTTQKVTSGDSHNDREPISAVDENESEKKINKPLPRSLGRGIGRPKRPDREAAETLIGHDTRSDAERLENGLDVEWAPLQAEGGQTASSARFVFSDKSDQRKSREEQKVDAVTPESFEEREEAEEPEHYLDLVQILALLLVPKLAKSAKIFHKDNDEVGCTTSAYETTSNNASNSIRMLNRLRQCWKTFVFQVTQAVWPSLTANDDEESIKQSELLLLKRIHKCLINGYAQDSSSKPFEPDNKSSSTSVAMTQEFVRNLLLRYGEVERAQDEDLLLAMVEAAHSASGTFDMEALANAVSSDLRLWDTDGDSRLSTFFYDIFGVEDPSKVSKPLGSTENQKVDGAHAASGTERAGNEDVECPIEDSAAPVATRCCQRGKPPPQFRTEVSSIDMVCETNTSAAIFVVIWTFFLLSCAIFAVLILQSSDFQTSCDVQKMGCIILNSVYSWTMLALILSVYGVAMIVPLSIGNNAYRRSIQRELFSVAVTLVYAIVPFLVIQGFERYVAREFPRLDSSIVNSPFWDPFQNLTLAVGLLLACMFLVEAVFGGVALLSWGRLHRVLSVLFVGSNTRSEARLKIASQNKIDAVLNSALSLHTAKPADKSLTRDTFGFSFNDTSVGPDAAVRNYVLYGERTEPSGGMLWTWWRIINGTLFYVEGIWINVRLFVFQFAQIVVGTMFSFFLFSTVRILADQAEEERENLEPGLPAWVVDLYPTRRMVECALYPAAVVATIVMIILILIYVPSATSTVLKYRCQLLSSLGSPNFDKLRKTADTAYMNTGNAVYGMLGAAVLFYLVLGLIIFLFQWRFSQRFMLRLLAWGIGLGITCALKFILTLGCRLAQYRGFYRTRPASASLTSLALECWFIGLGGSVLVGRVTQFLLAALFYVGRIDVPFLSEDVGIFGYRFDYVPQNFVKDLLLHEAHRHPYIERMSQLCLMRLLKKGKFVDDAGTCWRQLVVLAVFPWMSKHRLFDEERLKLAIASMEQERVNRVEAQKTYFDFAAENEVVDGLVGAAGTIREEIVHMTHRVGPTSRMGEF